ncbi:transposase [Chelativorans sp. AA-79]|uniref:transposase n=1 Tax=Chelativorans sp. AA-79 TaxID=3028735 RepID=UPI0023F99495|nr:transposase [Chelativorans sp. AA-79]WEX11541.1 transposase [Chelativorans sp. AA-79]
MEIGSYVGIDVSKDRLDVHILPQAHSVSVANNHRGIAELINILEPLRVERVVLEASGGYEKRCFAAMVEAGIAISIVNPRHVRDFAKGAGRTAKTDAIDAEMIAKFAEVFRPRETRPQSNLEAQLSDYLTYRRFLIRETIAIRNQLRRLTNPSIRYTLDKRLEAAMRECKEIDATMRQLVRNSDKRKLYDLLTSVPGVGPLLACTLIGNLRELGTLSRREIASLVGVAPMNRDSGRRRGHRFVTGGRGVIRHVLYMATLTACRFNRLVADFYARLRAVGKPAKVAITACMRKMLTILNAMARSGERWQEHQLV